MAPDIAQERLKHAPHLIPPSTPPTRNGFNYALRVHLPQFLPFLTEAVEADARRAAGALGLADPIKVGGSFRTPVLEVSVVGDGKVIAALSKYNPNYESHSKRRRVDEETGEVIHPRHDRDARLHLQGDGEWALGLKFVITLVRAPQSGRWIILSIRPMRKGQTEVGVGLDQLRDVVKGGLTELRHWSWDKAARGTHLDTVMQECGIIPLVRTHQRKGKKANRHLGLVEVKGGERAGTKLNVHLIAGQPHAAILDVNGNQILHALEGGPIHRRRNSDGSYRFYEEFILPDELGGGHITVRLDTTTEDRKNNFNRAEHLRAIPADDKRFRPHVIARNSIESANRCVDRALRETRAHHYTLDTNALSMLAYAFTRNIGAEAVWEGGP